MQDQPGGLRTGPPPSPPPRLLRPIVRLLLRSRAYRVRVPINSFSSCFCASNRLNLRDCLEFNEVLVAMMRQPAYDTCTGKEFPNVTLSDSQMQIVDAVGLVERFDLSL